MRCHEVQLVEQRTYRESLKDYWNLFSVTETAEKKGRRAGLAEGLEKGMKKGRKAGLKEGESIGLEKGRKEEKWQTARKLKILNVPIETIVQATGLSAEEIKEL